MRRAVMTREAMAAGGRGAPSAWLPPGAEAEAYEGLRNGDESSFVALAEPLQPVLQRRAAIAVAARADAQAIVVRTWELALGGLETFRWQTAFATWVAGITVGQARACPLLPSVHPSRAGPSIPQPPGPPTWDDLPWGARWADAMTVLQHAVRVLPYAQREVIHTRDIEGWPVRRVCDVLGLPEATCQRLLAEAREQLRGALSPLVGGPDGEDVRPAQTAAVVRCAQGLLDARAEPLDPRVVTVFRRWRRGPRRRRGALLARSGACS